MDFTAEQQAVIAGQMNNRVIYAGPGSGKTATLTHHLIHKIVGRQVSPSQVAVMTFTRQAAFELKHRVSQSMQSAPNVYHSMRIGTFHSLIFGILLSARIPVFPLATPQQQRRFMTDTLQRLYRPNTTESPDVWLAEISLLRSTWPPVSGTRQVQRIADAYTDVKSKSRMWYFDDVLETFCKRDALETLNLNKCKPIEYLLIDEFQDTNGMQLHILSRLQKRYQSPILVVGDEDQSIYAFRGANPTWLVQFPQLFENVKTHTLATNFRSDALIVFHANQLIQHNTNRTDKIPKVVRHAGGLVKAVWWRDERTEAEAIATRITHRTTDTKSIGILARTRTQLQHVALKLPADMRNIVHFHTLHDAKGKEWDEVHILGAVDPNPYLRRSTPLTSDEEEERRLFYVGMTRSREVLIIHCPRQVLGHRSQAIRFIHEAGITLEQGNLDEFTTEGIPS